MIFKLGLVDGLIFWFNLKKPGKPGQRFPGISSKVFWRRNGYDTTTLREIFLDNQYEMAEPRLGAVKFIIDAGANIGISSIYFHEKYPDAHVFAIEPEAENFSLLKKNSSNYPRIIPFHGALWYSETSLEVIDQGLGNRGFCVGDISNQTSNNVVESMSVSAIMKAHNLDIVDIVKIDIEGGEKELFLHNTDWIKKARCIIIELHDRIVPDCSKVFFEAIKNIPYRMEMNGENIFIFNQNLMNY